MSDEFRFLEENARRLGIENVPPVQRVTIPYRSTHLSALRWGTSKPEFVFVHGAALNAHTWDSTLLALGRPSIAVDLPGHGDSPWRSDGNYSPSVLAGELADALEALALSDLVVVGHSLGGFAATGALESLADRVVGLVIVDTSPGRQLGRKNTAVQRFLDGPRSFATLDDVVAHTIASGVGKDRASVINGIELNTKIAEDGRIIFKHHLGSIPPEQRLPAPDVTSHWDPLVSFTGPIALAYGDAGVLTGDEIRDFSDRLPLAEVWRFEAGHNVHRDQPVALAEALKKFRDEAAAAR